MCSYAAAYKKAVDDWVQAIRAAEALANRGPSMSAMELRDEAHFKKTTHARERPKHERTYKDALRNVYLRDMTHRIERRIRRSEFRRFNCSRQ